MQIWGWGSGCNGKFGGTDCDVDLRWGRKTRRQTWLRGGDAIVVGGGISNVEMGLHASFFVIFFSFFFFIFKIKYFFLIFKGNFFFPPFCKLIFTNLFSVFIKLPFQS